MLPLARPAMMTLAILTFLYAWNDYLWPLVSAREPERFTITLGLASIQSNFAQSEGLGRVMASGVIASLPVVILFLDVSTLRGPGHDGRRDQGLNRGRKCPNPREEDHETPIDRNRARRHGRNGRERQEVSLGRFFGACEDAGTDTTTSTGEACIIQSIINAADAELDGITVNTLPTDWGNYYDQIIAAYAGGEPPDVHVMHRHRVPQFAGLGALAELSGDLEAAGSTCRTGRPPRSMRSATMAASTASRWISTPTSGTSTWRSWPRRAS
jgi:hypothetical protein